MLYRDLKHEVIAECFRRDEARTMSFLNVLRNSPLNTLICEKCSEIYFFEAKKLTSSLPIKARVSLSRKKTRHGNHFSHEFLNFYKL